MKWLAATVLVALFLCAALVGYVHLQPAPSSEWKVFAIGPAAGGWMSNQNGAIRSEGISVLGLLAWVHRIPPQRVVGPESLAMRFALDAAVYDDNSETLRSLLRRELEARFHLQTHKETRPCDVWVLTASRQHLLNPVKGRPSSLINGHDHTVKLAASTMGEVAGNLQLVLGRPVVDETELPDRYNLAFGWSADRDGSIVRTLREQFGLFLTPSTRDLEVLVVDCIRPDLPLAIFSGIDHVTQYGPAALRQSISRGLTIR